MSVIEIAMILFGQIFTAGAIYGAIRSDLRQALEMSKRAHERIDELMMKGQH